MTDAALNGHEQRGQQDRMIVQADELPLRSVVPVAPTSLTARTAAFCSDILLPDETTRALVEQVGASDAGRLGDLERRVSPDRQWGIDEALTTVLGLP